MMNNPVTVQFIRPRSPYNAGDVATFEAEQAQALANSGHVVAMTVEQYKDRQMRAGRPVKEIDAEIKEREETKKEREEVKKELDARAAKAAKEAESKETEGRKRLGAKE
jgi:hypothetical protein